MTDDLVTRLRGQRTNGVLCDEAANEIERLRTDIASFKNDIVTGYQPYVGGLEDDAERLRADLREAQDTIEGCGFVIDKIKIPLYPYRSTQVSSHSWNVFRKWYWEVSTQDGSNQGYCFTKKNAYKKAGMKP